MDIENETLPKVDEYKSFAGVKFDRGARAYFFGVKPDLEVALDDKVVVETVRGTEVGFIAIAPLDINHYHNKFELKPILRIATNEDLQAKAANEKDAGFALKICQNEVLRLSLDMHLLSCEYTLDRSKVIFSYVADERVDFRELLKALAAKLRTRIELRQIGSRDKAKMVGGIGICGLPLCCASFLNEFEGISITRAKNQMLAINIPKLSGHCGKLLCCLKYEDDIYTSEREKYPEIGSTIKYDNQEWTVGGINIVSTVVRLDGNDNEVRYIPLDDLRANRKPKPKDEINISQHIIFDESILDDIDTNKPQEKRFRKPKRFRGKNEKK